MSLTYTLCNVVIHLCVVRTPSRCEEITFREYWLKRLVENGSLEIFSSPPRSRYAATRRGKPVPSGVPPHPQCHPPGQGRLQPRPGCMGMLRAAPSSHQAATTKQPQKRGTPVRKVAQLLVQPQQRHGGLPCPSFHAVSTVNGGCCRLQGCHAAPSQHRRITALAATC